jgi:hypothetical protein
MIENKNLAENSCTNSYRFVSSKWSKSSPNFVKEYAEWTIEKRRRKEKNRKCELLFRTQEVSIYDL